MLRLIYTLVFVALLSAPVFAAPPQPVTLGEVIDTLEKPFASAAPAEESIYQFEADFFQQSHISSLDRSQRGDGHVWMQFAPRMNKRVSQVKFRWEYQEPTRQEFISNGQKLWVYLPENRQVILSDIEHISQARADSPMTFLTGLGNLSRDFLLHWSNEQRDFEGNYILELTPRIPTSLFRRMLVVVSEAAVLARHDGQPDNSIFPILSTTVYDPYDNLTIIEFRNVRTNDEVFLPQFDFIVPAGIDVVRPSGQTMGF